MEISACGIDCSKCSYFKITCDGCIAVKGSPFWAKDFFPGKICSLYECAVIKNSFKNCGQCNELPCKMYVELKDPNMSDEEHKKSIVERVQRLKQNLN